MKQPGKTRGKAGEKEIKKTRKKEVTVNCQDRKRHLKMGKGQEGRRRGGGEK